MITDRETMTYTGDRTGECILSVFFLFFLDMNHEMYSHNIAVVSLHLFHSNFYN